MFHGSMIVHRTLLANPIGQARSVIHSVDIFFVFPSSPPRFFATSGIWRPSTTMVNFFSEFLNFLPFPFLNSPWACFHRSKPCSRRHRPPDPPTAPTSSWRRHSSIAPPESMGPRLCGPTKTFCSNDTSTRDPT